MLGHGPICGSPICAFGFPWPESVSVPPVSPVGATAPYVILVPSDVRNAILHPESRSVVIKAERRQ